MLLKKAESNLLEFYKHQGNKWFTDVFWPENRKRIELCVLDALRLSPPPAKVLDVGAHNGFATRIFAEVGYSATACDALDIVDRRELLEGFDTDFVQSNLNDPNPLTEFDTESFDIVFMGEIFEHILNSPRRLLENVSNILARNGLLLLTTPNPSTLANASRLVIGRSLLRGEKAFTSVTKFKDGDVTADPTIHYREYTTDELTNLISDVGLDVEAVRYIPVGSSASQDVVRRSAKRFASGLLRTRLFGRTQYVRARKTTNMTNHANSR